MHSLKTVLVANRGEIAVRCINACKKLGVTSVALFTDADAGSLHIQLADRRVHLSAHGSAAYTDIDQILKICNEESVQGVIPGYGFLSENPEFARRVEEQGMVFIGPDAKAIESMALKHTARDLAVAAGVPVIKGSGILRSVDEAIEAATTIGFPAMMKASGGGGGIGTQICWTVNEVPEAYGSVQRTSEKLFKDAGVFLEQYFPKSHHIEVQIFGTGKDVVHFGERECSIQRRRQKVIEETPSPFLAGKEDLRNRLTSCAVSLGESIGYRSAGTIEYLVDNLTGEFFFLEMNTRLQVEHGITELRYGVDIVQLMLDLADTQLSGQSFSEDKLTELRNLKPTGHAIEARVCSESPALGFMPCIGLIQELTWPGGDTVRVDSWIQKGVRVSPYFDSLLAKLMVFATDRTSAITEMLTALEATRISGLTTTVPFLSEIVGSEAYVKGNTLTTFLDEQFTYQPSGVEVKTAGAFTTIQQARERTTKGYGIPKSGPMDDISAAIANLVVGNTPDTECLEVTQIGPELRFHSAGVVAICGAAFHVDVNGASKKMWSRIVVQPGQILKVGEAVKFGGRCYIAIQGGLPSSPTWLGSKSTTPSLELGGLQGRALRQGDFFDLTQVFDYATIGEVTLPLELLPSLDSSTIYVMHGPHDSPDFITKRGLEILHGTTWKVDHNASRTGMRMVGPTIEWARTSGGVGGSHPSNVVDYPYPSPGGINWTGDSAVIFPIDAPGFGGFLCSSTIPSAELWKLAYVQSGDGFRLAPVSYESARKLATQKNRLFEAVEKYLATGEVMAVPPIGDTLEQIIDTDAILDVIPGKGSDRDIIMRQGGDTFVFVDIGFQQVDLQITVSANLLARAVEGIAGSKVHIAINSASFMIEYDPAVIEQSEIVSFVKQAHGQVQTFDKPLSCRRLVLPIVFDHPVIQEAEDRYMKLQRNKAAYLPDNVTYVAENNGLASRDNVFDILTKTRYLVVAVGFMTGLPLLLSLDPRGRLVSQKHNPTRIHTPSGSVGLGGTIVCVYPGIQPGGLMLMGRSLPVWDTFSFRESFTKDKPWLCEPFDLVEFKRVSLEEYDTIEKAFEVGVYKFDIQDTSFDVAKELALEQQIMASPELLEFKKRQAEASETMKQREAVLKKEWDDEQAAIAASTAVDNNAAGAGEKVMSSQAGRIWKILVKPGDRIAAGMPLVILEAMKMEINVLAEGRHGGLVVDKIFGKEGALVDPGSLLLSLQKGI